MRGDEGVRSFDAQSSSMRADAVRRAGPDGVQHGVKKVAALRGGEAGFGGLPGLRAETSRGKGFEGALRLGGENAGAAFDLAGREGNAAESSKELRERLRAGGRGKAPAAAVAAGRQSCVIRREGRASTPSLWRA